MEAPYASCAGSLSAAHMDTAVMCTAAQSLLTLAGYMVMHLVGASGPACCSRSGCHVCHWCGWCCSWQACQSQHTESSQPCAWRLDIVVCRREG